MTLAEMREARAKAVLEMRAINDKAQKDGERAFSADEAEAYRKLEADVDKADKDIPAEEKRMSDEVARKERLEALEKQQRQAPPPVEKPSPGGHKPEERQAGAPDEHPYAKHLRFMAPVYRSQEYREAFELAMAGDYAAANKRADTLQVGLFAKGGALVPPETFLAELLKGIDDDVFVRRNNPRVFRLAQSQSLGVPSLDTDLADADWTSELLTGSQGDITVGKRELKPHPLAKRIKISKTLSRVSAIPIAQLVQERLRYKFSVTEEKAFLTGDGVNKPLGIFTASANGVPTTQDVSTANTTTAITADGLINAKHAMKAAYWARARWIFHRDAIKEIRKLKDGNGQYLWQPGMNGGQVNTIFDLPYDVSEFAPNTFTTGLYVGAVAAWPFYWIADALDMTILLVDQLYAETNQDGYIARRETDGAPVLAEAFVRVTLA